MTEVRYEDVPRKSEKIFSTNEKTHRIKTDDRIVEVTVKVKGRKDKYKPQLNPPDSLVYRAGSWGDLLMKKKLESDSVTEVDGRKISEAPKLESRKSKKKVSDVVKYHYSERDKSEKSPRSKSKYTAVNRKIGKDDPNNGIETAFEEQFSKDADYVRDDKYADIDACVHGRCCAACTCHRINMKDQESQTVIPPAYNHQSPPTKDMQKNSTTPKLNNVQASRSAPVQTKYNTEVDGLNRSFREPTTPGTNRRHARTSDVFNQAQFDADVKKLNELQKENEKLRKDAESLFKEVSKAKTERTEYITTIKELYELAEVLRHENVVLLGNHEEHQRLQHKLQEAVGENQILKQHLHELTSKSSVRPESSKGNVSQEVGINQFWKLQEVIKDAKSILADEIHGFRKTPMTQADVSKRLELMEILGKSDLQLSALNDSNFRCDDEIQQIFNVSREHPDRSDVRSSTQYLDVEDGESFEQLRRYLPSPILNED